MAPSVAAADGTRRRADIAAGVVLAAGEGRRMGAPKALVRVAGRPLVHQAVAALSTGGCDPVAVITGAAADEVRAAAGMLADPHARVAIVHNDHWADGMATSVAAGLSWAGSSVATAAVLLPVDTPGIGSAVVARLLARWRRDGAEPTMVLVATYDGRQRNPVLFGREHWSDVTSALGGDEGARGWLAAHPELITPVECGDLGDPTDLDTPADLDRWAGHATTTP